MKILITLIVGILAFYAITFLVRARWIKFVTPILMLILFAVVFSASTLLSIFMVES